MQRIDSSYLHVSPMALVVDAGTHRQGVWCGCHAIIPQTDSKRHKIEVCIPLIKKTGHVRRIHYKDRTMRR